jgi:hypothetical protein
MDNGEIELQVVGTVKPFILIFRDDETDDPRFFTEKELLNELKKNPCVYGMRFAKSAEEIWGYLLIHEGKIVQPLFVKDGSVCECCGTKNRDVLRSTKSSPILREQGRVHQFGAVDIICLDCQDAWWSLYGNKQNGVFIDWSDIKKEKDLYFRAKHKNGYENVITAEEARKITSESIIKSIDIQPYLNVIHYSIRNAAKDGKSFIRERMDKWAVLIPPSTESKIEICKVLIEEGYNIKSVAGLNQTNPEELGMYEDIEISW